MDDSENFQMEPELEATLNELLNIVSSSKIIQDYQKIELQSKNNPKLLELVEEIKREQKNAVKYAHYGKPVAEQGAIKRADELTNQFDEHPLVVDYRMKLIAANDLLQYITNKLEDEIQLTFDLNYQDALKKLYE